MSKRILNDGSDMAIILPDVIHSNYDLPDPTLLQYYRDLGNRVIWIDTDIDVSALDIIAKILHWNREDQHLPIAARQPIKLFFHSPGGQLDVEEAIVSIIKLSKTPVHGVALGMVASAASLIYLSCHKRYALPNAYFIFHRGSCANMGGNYNEIAAAMEDYKAQIEKMEKFYIEHTKYSEKEIREKISTDWYVHCDEALEKGVVTDIITDVEVLL